MEKYEAIIYRQGKLYDSDYVRDNNLEDDFTLLTLDVAQILGVRRENVHKYILPQLDYVRADKALKESFNNRQITNLISIKSVNEYINLAFTVAYKQIAITVPRKDYNGLLKNSFPGIKLSLLQSFIEQGLTDLSYSISDEPVKQLVEFPTEYDFVKNHILWSNGLFLKEIFNYNQQVIRMLKNASYVKGQIPLCQSSSDKGNDKGIRYILTDKPSADEIYAMLYSRRIWSFPLSYKLFHYINYNIYCKYGVFKKSANRDSSDITEKFIIELLGHLKPFVFNRYDEYLIENESFSIEEFA